MKIRFKKLKLVNFKNHKDLTVDFGERTEIKGDNGQGKSTVGEAISFLTYGLDLVGGKLDPTPTTYEADETLSELLLEVDGKDVLLGRSVVKGVNKFFINEVPSKAAEFNEVIEKIVDDKNLFLSLFNPTFFSTLHWEKQREMILKYVPAPVNKEVFKVMTKPQADKLKVLVKKHSLEDLEKVHRVNKTKLDKSYIAAQSRTKTLKEQLDQEAPTVPFESLTLEKADWETKRNTVEKSMEVYQETNAKRNVLQNKVNAMSHERDSLKNDFIRMKAEEIQSTCRVCKQDLQEDAVSAVEAEKEQRLSKVREMHKASIAARKALEDELTEIEYVDVSEQLELARNAQFEIEKINRELDKHERTKGLLQTVNEATVSEKETLLELNESIFIIDAIKEFKSKEAELQSEKVQGLFSNLSIKLFERVKTTGEDKPTFVVQMDGKDYAKLSFSEKTKAGLELRDVLSEQSEIIAPCFIDNAETITTFKAPSGQLITARVVAGQELTIETEEN